LSPIKVVSTSGNVQNAQALVWGGYTTLSWGGTGTAPQVILDYGHDVAGLPVFDVAAVSGTPKLQAIYSESQQYLLPEGDGAPSFPNAPGDPSRVDTYAVSGPGLIINRLIQGGERFQAITLTAPGSVTLNRVGIRAKFFLPQPTANRGFFRSSDSQLNEIWDLGAYTLRLCQVPARSVPPFWTVTATGLDVTYSPVALYQGGGPWADYTSVFDSQVIANEAAWVVRDNGLLGYVMVLDTDDDTLNLPNALRVFSVGLFGSTPVATVPLAPLGIDLKVRTWHSVKTVAVGGQVSVFIDDKPITIFNVPTTGFPSVATGSFGFTNANGAEAQFRRRAVSKSRRNANRVLSSQPRIYRLAFKSEDSEDALVNTTQWFTSDEPLQGFNTQREFPRGK
jgi:alpha-L-rhamnosidase